MIFLDHLYEIYDNDEQLNIYHMQFIDKIKYIIIHFLFENPTEVIDINKLASELQPLNDLIAKFDTARIKEEKEEKVNYLLSLTKIAADDIKEIGGQLIGSSKGKQTNKIRRNATNISKGRSKSKSRSTSKR